jgi:5-methylcytosine-specific restriction protein A
MSVYSTPAWRRRRKRYLAAHPTCTSCPSPATEVDHVIPRAQLVEQGVDDPDADHWLQSLCESCHSTKTATTDGGFGRDVLNIDER